VIFERHTTTVLPPLSCDEKERREAPEIKRVTSRSWQTTTASLAVVVCTVVQYLPKETNNIEA
jgi:hypothetical protein